MKFLFSFSKEVISKELINWEWLQKGKGVSKTGYFLTQPSLAFPDMTWANPTRPIPRIGLNGFVQMTKKIIEQLSHNFLQQ